MLGGVLGIDPISVSATPLYTLGSVGYDKNGKWKYVKTSSSVAQYDPVKIEADGTCAATSSLTTTLAGSGPIAVGIAQVAIASGYYAWIWIGEGGGTGSGVKVNVLASAVAGAKLYTTATAGALDDTATTLIAGLTIMSTNGGSTAAVECYSPLVLTANA